QPTTTSSLTVSSKGVSQSAPSTAAVPVPEAESGVAALCEVEPEPAPPHPLRAREAVIAVAVQAAPSFSFFKVYSSFMLNIFRWGFVVFIVSFAQAGFNQ